MSITRPQQWQYIHKKKLNSIEFIGFLYTSHIYDVFLQITTTQNMDMNRVMLIGRATGSVDKKIIESSNSAVVNFVIATNRKYKNKEWNIMEEAEYHRCVAYGNSAEVLAKYLHKGKRIYVEGRLRTRKWQDSAGNNRYSTEIIVTHFIFLDNKSGEDDVIETIAWENSEADDILNEDMPF